jgi:predicted nucleic-acid-binding protein
MIGLDTNVLARYYIDDDADAEAQRQRLAARRLIESGQPLMVSKSVILELEWVMRGYYSFAQAEVASVMRHLLEQPHIAIEDREEVERALSNCESGIEFADALHHASYKSCDSVSTFDDRRFARRAKKLGLAPAVVVLSSRKLA